MQSRFVFNPLDKEVKVRIHGSWFVFKPKQIKQMNEDKVDYISTSCAWLGLVPLPNEFEDYEYKDSPEGKDILEKATKNGRESRYSYCHKIFNNQAISLKKELEGTGIDYRSSLTPELESLFEELAAFRKTDVKTNEKNVKKMDELEKLMK